MHLLRKELEESIEGDWEARLRVQCTEVVEVGLGAPRLAALLDSFDGPLSPHDYNDILCILCNLLAFHYPVSAERSDEALSGGVLQRVLRIITNTHSRSTPRRLAVTCMEAIVCPIRARRDWPPAEKTAAAIPVAASLLSNNDDEDEEAVAQALRTLQHFINVRHASRKVFRVDTVLTHAPLQQLLKLAAGKSACIAVEALRCCRMTCITQAYTDVAIDSGFLTLVASQLRDGDTDVRPVCCRIIHDIVKDATRARLVITSGAVPGLVAALEARCESSRHAAARAVGALAAAGTAVQAAFVVQHGAVPALLELLWSPRAGHAPRAVAALLAHGRNDAGDAGAVSAAAASGAQLAEGIGGMPRALRRRTRAAVWCLRRGGLDEALCAAVLFCAVPRRWTPLARAVLRERARRLRAAPVAAALAAAAAGAAAFELRAPPLD